jgi:serine/threonine-protein kinase RsbW
VEIALSEACANVLRHAQVGDSYEVRAGFDTQRAFLEIIDQGGGIPDTEHVPAEDDAESGRGVTLMRALMDKVRFESRSGDGASVVLEKTLTFLPNSPLTTMEQVSTPPASVTRPTESPSEIPDATAEPTA